MDNYEFQADLLTALGSIREQLEKRNELLWEQNRLLERLSGTRDGGTQPAEGTGN